MVSSSILSSLLVIVIVLLCSIEDKNLCLKTEEIMQREREGLHYRAAMLVEEKDNHDVSL
jgi:hypothetical protein